MAKAARNLEAEAPEAEKPKKTSRREQGRLRAEAARRRLEQMAPRDQARESVVAGKKEVAGIHEQEVSELDAANRQLEDLLARGIIDQRYYDNALEALTSNREQEARQTMAAIKGLSGQEATIEMEGEGPSPAEEAEHARAIDAKKQAGAERVHGRMIKNEQINAAAEAARAAADRQIEKNARVNEQMAKEDATASAQTDFQSTRGKWESADAVLAEHADEEAAATSEAKPSMPTEVDIDVSDLNPSTPPLAEGPALKAFEAEEEQRETKTAKDKADLAAAKLKGREAAGAAKRFSDRLHAPAMPKKAESVDINLSDLEPTPASPAPAPEPLTEAELATVQSTWQKLKDRVKNWGRKPLATEPHETPAEMSDEDKRAVKAEWKTYQQAAKSPDFEKESMARYDAQIGRQIHEETAEEGRIQARRNQANETYAKEAGIGAVGMDIKQGLEPEGAANLGDSAEAWFDKAKELSTVAAERADETNLMDLATRKEFARTLGKHERDILNTLLAEDPTTGYLPPAEEVARRVSEFERFPENGPIPAKVTEFLRNNNYLPSEVKAAPPAPEAAPAVAEAATAPTATEGITFTPEEAEMILSDFDSANKAVADQLRVAGWEPQDIAQIYLLAKNENKTLTKFVSQHAGELLSSTDGEELDTAHGLPEDLMQGGLAPGAERPAEAYARKATLAKSPAQDSEAESTDTTFGVSEHDFGGIRPGETPPEALATSTPAPTESGTVTNEPFDETPDHAAMIDNEEPFAATADKKTKTKAETVKPAPTPDAVFQASGYRKDAELEALRDEEAAVYLKNKKSAKKKTHDDTAVDVPEYRKDPELEAMRDEEAALANLDKNNEISDQAALSKELSGGEKMALREKYKTLAGGKSGEPKVLAWYKVYEGVDNKTLKKKIDLLRQYWAKKEGKADYIAGSETYKKQTGEALRRIVDGEVKMSLDSGGEVNVTTIKQAAPARRGRGRGRGAAGKKAA